MSFVSSKGNILCRLVKIELYKIFAIINRAIKGLLIDIAVFINGLAQDCSNSIANALELQQSCSVLSHRYVLISQIAPRANGSTLNCQPQSHVIKACSIRVHLCLQLVSPI